MDVANKVDKAKSHEQWNYVYGTLKGFGLEIEVLDAVPGVLSSWSLWTGGSASDGSLWTCGRRLIVVVPGLPLPCVTNAEGGLM
jgi:hypothetical protein